MVFLTACATACHWRAGGWVRAARTACPVVVHLPVPPSLRRRGTGSFTPPPSSCRVDQGSPARVLCAMVATSATAGAVAPWTVISQGSSLTYEQATGLDKLEFAQRSQGPALSRLLDDEGHVKRATVCRGSASASVGRPWGVRLFCFSPHSPLLSPFCRCVCIAALRMSFHRAACS